MDLMSMNEAQSESFSGQSFQFNFPSPEAEENFVPIADDGKSLERQTSNQRNVLPMELIRPDVDEDYLKAAHEGANAINVCSRVIKYVSSPSVFKKFSNKKFVEKYLEFEENKSDLIPGVYEGGFKVWECALDLACYLLVNKCLQSHHRVLELGCGAGIPGIISYLSGCKVTFQDYNAEVLELSTIPNIYINTPAHDQDRINERCTFLSGDWNDIRLHLLHDEKYDMIITSETIYEKANHTCLLNLMKCSLKPSGVIYLAAKSYYFGVGGTLDDFQLLIEKDGVFDSQLVHDVQEGVQRKIIQLRFKDDKRK